MFHPVFADLTEQARSQVALLALDAALGEVDTELWVGDGAARPRSRRSTGSG